MPTNPTDKPAFPDISGDDTMQMRSGDTPRSGVTFYHLHAAAHRMASECERLFAHAERPDRRAWRDALGEALLGSRHVLSLVTHWQEPQGTEALYDEIREPQQRVIDGVTRLLGFVPIDPVDEALLRDARLIRESAVHLAASLPPSSAIGGPATDGGDVSTMPVRLLVVDDDEALRRALSRLLTRLGYRVVVAANGREGLELARQEPFDLVITDIAMPEMTGLDLLKHLKADNTTRHLPVIVVSGDSDLESVVQCIEEGAEDHISKPYETVLLQARVRATLERKRMRDGELAYLARVASLAAAAEAVERGTYVPGTIALPPGPEDELTRLTRLFDHMVTSLKSREEQLENRLQELRREIRQSRSAPEASGAVSEESPFAVNEILADRYVILGELGKGGMGMVYRARDRQLGEEVAMKVVRSDLVGQDPALLERLKSEIRLARRISHRNVVRAHDWGEWRGEYFFTMEYVKGITVAHLLRTRGRLTVQSTLAIGTQLAEALAVAHEQQIIHRDIKPGNLLVDDEGVLKVMDFGLARLVQRTDELTQTGLVVGTPRYMAPEQLFGAEVDGRTDLFAVGVVLYECLAGKPPFDASTPAAVIAQIVEGRRTPLRQLVSDVPPSLDAVISRLLERDRTRRFATAHELSAQLARLGQSPA